MFDDPKYEMTPFQRDLYRFHMGKSRRAGTSHTTVTTISIGSGDTENRHVATLNRMLPDDLAGITRILRVDDIRNSGEGEVSSGQGYPERQILRVFAELEDDGRGVMAMTLDRLHGRLDWQFQYASWGGAQVGGGARTIAKLIEPDCQPYVLALYRLCELLDADEEKGGHGLYRDFIAEALLRPEGFGFPKFTAGIGRSLPQRHTTGPKAMRDGPPEKVEQGNWYVHGRRDNNQPLGGALRFWVGQAQTGPGGGRPFWRDDAVCVTYENGGHGRATPEYQYYIGSIWLSADDSFWEIDETSAQAILRHVVPPPTDTGAIMQALLTVP